MPVQHQKMRRKALRLLLRHTDEAVDELRDDNDEMLRGGCTRDLLSSARTTSCLCLRCATIFEECVHRNTPLAGRAVCPCQRARSLRHLRNGSSFMRRTCCCSAPVDAPGAGGAIVTAAGVHSSLPEVHPRCCLSSTCLVAPWCPHATLPALFWCRLPVQQWLGCHRCGLGGGEEVR